MFEYGTSGDLGEPFWRGIFLKRLLFTLRQNKIAGCPPYTTRTACRWRARQHEPTQRRSECFVNDFSSNSHENMFAVTNFASLDHYWEEASHKKVMSSGKCFRWSWIDKHSKHWQIAWIQQRIFWIFILDIEENVWYSSKPIFYYHGRAALEHNRHTIFQKW